MAAKDKTQDICRNMLYFDGEVVKDKATKQKIPNGYGKLFINGYDGYNRVDNVSITGDFNGDIVENATFQVNDNGRCYWNDSYNQYTIKNKKIFNGKMSYTYSYDKPTRKLYLIVNLLDGELLCQPFNIPITPENKIQYKMAFEKSDRIPYNRQFNISPLSIKTSTRIYTNYNDDVFSILSPLIEENYWETTNAGDWIINWLGGKLKNGLTIRTSSSNSDFFIDGPNGIKFQSNSDSGKLPLSDGGYLSWTNGGKSMQLHYPNGEKYSGAFENIPFQPDYLHPNCLSKVHANAVKKIIESSVSDFVISNGTLIHPSGECERVKEGKFIDRQLERSVQSDKTLDFSSLISNALRLSNNTKEFSALCKQDFWSYLGRGDMSELDKSIYKKSSEYEKNFNAYSDALNGLFFEIIPCYMSDFTEKGANVYKTNRDDILKALPLIPISIGNVGYMDCALPVKSSCLIKPKSDNEYGKIKLPIISTDIDYLKYLQEANNDEELSLLCIFKPGVQVNSYFDTFNYVPTSVGLYLINNKTNTILTDLSKYLDTDNPSKYKNIFKQREASVKGEKKKKADTEVKEYKRKYGANASPCGTCAGTGQRTYTNSTTGTQYKKTCNICGGTGRVYK